MSKKHFIKNWINDEYTISTDDSKLQIKVIYEYLSNISYWSKEITLERIQRSIDNSLCFGPYHKGKQIGFARCITDFATYGYLCDVFILPSYQKNDLGKWLIETIFGIDELKLRRWTLATKDAHGLYKKVGFTPLEKPEIYMHKYNPEFYSETKETQNNNKASINLINDNVSHDKEENLLGNNLRAKL